MFGIKQISDEVNEEFSKTTKKSLHKMFYALIEQPSHFEKLYRKAIYGPKSRLIMLASNIRKESPNNFKLKAKKIFSKITSVISK